MFNPLRSLSGRPELGESLPTLGVATSFGLLYGEPLGLDLSRVAGALLLLLSVLGSRGKDSAGPRRSALGCTTLLFACVVAFGLDESGSGWAACLLGLLACALLPMNARWRAALARGVSVVLILEALWFPWPSSWMLLERAWAALVVLIPGSSAARIPLLDLLAWAPLGVGLVLAGRQWMHAIKAAVLLAASAILLQVSVSWGLMGLEIEKLDRLASVGVSLWSGACLIGLPSIGAQVSGGGKWGSTDRGAPCSGEDGRILFSPSWLKPRWLAASLGLGVVLFAWAWGGSRDAQAKGALGEEGNSAPQRIVFYQTEGSRISNFRVPMWGSYGYAGVGMFGLLRRYLIEDGLDVEVSTDAPAEMELDEVAALVLLNASTSWSKEDCLSLWRFVRRGGTLMVFGDHTAVGDTLVSQNDVLAPFGIELQFDTAVPLGMDSWGEARMAMHPALGARARAGLASWGLGASLELSSSNAKPLILHPRLHFDQGDWNATDSGYMGNLALEKSERTGGGILAATAQYGQGRLMAFADTSVLQNEMLIRSYEGFVLPLFEWAASPDNGGSRSGALSAFLHAGLLLAAAAVGSSRMWLFAPIRLVALGSAGALLGVLLVGSSNPDALARESTARAVWIDLEHAPRLAPRGGLGAGINGFVRCLQRSYLRPRLLRESGGGELKGAHALVLLSPSRDFEAERIREIGQFVRDGGILIASAGFPEFESLEPLMRQFGLSVMPNAVGPIPLREGSSLEGQEVEFECAWEVREESSECAGDAWVYADFMGVPLAVLKRVGQGAVFLVGDTGFFTDSNLEELDQCKHANLQFLRAVLQDLEQVKQEVVE